MARTPKQIAQHAQIITDRIISDLYDFIEMHDVDKAAIAHKINVSRTSISNRLSKTREPKLSSLLKIVAAIEDLTGARFEQPTFTREKGASNAKFKGEATTATAGEKIEAGDFVYISEDGKALKADRTKIDNH